MWMLTSVLTEFWICESFCILYIFLSKKAHFQHLNSWLWLEWINSFNNINNLFSRAERARSTIHLLFKYYSHAHIGTSDGCKNFVFTRENWVDGMVAGINWIFCHLWPNSGKYLALANIFQMWHISYLYIWPNKFPVRCLTFNHNFVFQKVLTKCKLWKKTYWCQFSYFLHNPGPNLVQILSQDHTHFFCWFSMKYLS